MWLQQSPLGAADSGLNLGAMNKLDLTRRLARASHRSQAQAADEVDVLVYELLKNLGQPFRSKQKSEARRNRAPSVPMPSTPKAKT